MEAGYRPAWIKGGTQVTSNIVFPNGRRFCTMLLVGTALGGLAVPAAAQAQSGTAQPSPVQQVPAIPLQPNVAPTPAPQVIRSISVSGNQRLEAETVLSYISLRPGEPLDRDRADQALRELYATELFADAIITGVETGDLVIQVRENPVINRIILEGNKRLKEDKILPRSGLLPARYSPAAAPAPTWRALSSCTAARTLAATVEPQIVQLDQNRVDVVFEIDEGPVSRVRQINIIGNEAFSDGQLQGEMATRESRPFPLGLFSGGSASYDPDRLAFDQAKLRLYYLTQGYADFRVVSAVAS
jgi:outer membrane protein insertion porin family